LPQIHLPCAIPARRRKRLGLGNARTP
jgi:hypothetical protein